MDIFEEISNLFSKYGTLAVRKTSWDERETIVKIGEVAFKIPSNQFHGFIAIARDLTEFLSQKLKIRIQEQFLVPGEVILKEISK